MTACSVESDTIARTHWASQDFWERVRRLNPHPDLSDADGRIEANVTGFMAESGICRFIHSRIEQELHNHPLQDGLVTPHGVEIHKITARSEREAGGRRNCRLVVSYLALTQGEKIMAFYETDLYGWTELGVLPDYEQVRLLQEIEIKLHAKALEFDVGFATQTV